MRGLILLLLTLTASCGARSPDEAISACKDVVELGERYASTVGIIQSDATAEVIARDQAANLLLGESVAVKKSFVDLKSHVSSIQPAALTDTSEFPQGNDGDQAKLLKAVIDRLDEATEPGLLTTEIRYDVDNGNGVPERRQASCKFLMFDTKSREPIIPYSVAVALERSRQKTFGTIDVPNKGYKCCIPDFALANVDPRFATPVVGRVIMGDEIEVAVRDAMHQYKRRGGR